MRLAPTEKSAASVPTTSAAKFVSASWSPASSIATVSPPMAFIFEWKSTASTPSPRSTRLAPGVAAHDALPLFRRLENLQVGRRRRQRPFAESLLAAPQHVRDQRRRILVADRLEHVANAEGVPRLEWTELPAEAPPHRPIDIVDRVAMSGATRARVDERLARAWRAGTRRPCRARRTASASARRRRRSISRPRARRAAPTASAGSRASRDRASGSRRPPSGRIRGRSSRRPSRVRSESRRAPASRSVARSGSGRRVARFVIDVAEHVDAGDVHGAERGALRPADRRSRDRVDLLDRILAGFERAQRLHDAEQGDAVGDEVGRVFRDDDALAEAAIERSARCARATSASVSAVGITSTQPQVTRRIEEVGSEPVPPELVAPALGKRRDRNARGVGGHDRPRPPHPLDSVRGAPASRRRARPRPRRSSRRRRGGPGRCRSRRW